jgi:hypothetical protein
MRGKISVILLFVSVALLALHSAAAAHGQTEVGDYELEIGFHNEPAYLYQPNGLDLFVTNTKTDERVNGLADTLQAEIIYGSSKKTLNLEPQEEDGAYTAYVVPTELGDYTWHIFGKIEDTPVDVSMTSSPDTFGSVEPLSDYAFPASKPANTGPSSTTLLIIGVAGVVLGALALIVGVLAFLAAGRRRA